MMKIEWDEPPVPKRNVDSLWTKVKNNISVLRQKHDGPAPREHQHSSNERQSRSRTMSTHQRSTSSPSRPAQRSRSVGPSSPTYASRQHYGPSSPRSPTRPYVTIQTNGGPPQAVAYGASYVIQSPSPVSMQSPIYPAIPAPIPVAPVYINSSGAPSPRPTVHRSATHGHVHSPLRSSTTPSTPTRSGASTPRVSGNGGYSGGGVGGRPMPSRNASTPVTYDRDGNPGIMCNGKLIVGDPDEVKRYVSAQESIQRWRENVR